ncbi:MAG: site-2 protease family protein [Methylophagaceae bacterium]
MGNFTLIQNIVIWALPVLFAITVHEVAHGWTALKFGDRTAQMMGRLTLNPIKHIDPIGTLLVPGMLLAAGGFIFGWAKPVPVTWQNLNNPKKDMIWVALAGPLANLLMAIIWALIAKIGLVMGGSMQALFYMGVAGIQINAVLMLLNLLPLPPLDGGRILVGLLPGPLAWRVNQVEPYGFFILVGLIYFGIISMILSPLMRGFMSILFALFGLN